MIDALAYIDPGSGSLIIQAVVATIVAVPFFFRQQIARMVRAVRGTDAETASTTADERQRAPDLRR